MSDQMHPVETQVIDEPQRVRGPLLYFVGRLALARAHPAMIKSHDLECRGKGGNLCHPVGAVFAKARHEHDGWTCARNVIGQRSAIDRDHRHLSCCQFVWDGLAKHGPALLSTHTHLPETSPCVRIRPHLAHLCGGESEG